MKRNKLLLLVSLFFLNVTLYSATESVKLIRQNQTISAVTRAGNVVTVTLSSNFPNDNLKAGQKIVIKNVTPTSFNGTFTIASVASQTSFTYNQTAIDASGSGGTAGGDYTSLVTWEDTEKGDLVFLNQIAVAECYDDWTGNGMDIGTGYFTISRDWGTSASCYVKIYVPPNERRAAANPLRYRGGTTARGFGITGADSASYEGLIRTYANYIKFEGLQVWCKATPYNISALSISEVTSSNKIEITDCVLAGACGRALAVSCAPGIGVPKVYVRNTLMYTSFSGDHYSLLITNDVASGTECYLYNCVIGNGFACARIGTAIAKNTYAARWYPSPDSIFTGNNNAGGTAVVPGGGTLTDLDGGNLFVDITSGAEDFHLREYSPLADAGVDLSADAIMPFSNDIDGQTRSGSWDIGCDEYGATQSVPTITTPTLANGGVGSSYNVTLTATGGTAPYSWTNTTALPAGLTLSAAGAISGTPTAVGSTTTTFRVTDSLSAVATKDLCITVQAALPLTITTTNLANGGVGSVYSAT
ncbi:MAG: Ig domain-containing protein, partial [Elusimicrobiota bacterium]